MDDIDTLVLAAMLQELVEEPVERKGILSRIEHHIVHVRDEQNQIANHDAQIMAARHEFMRDALVAVGNDVLAIKATMAALLKQASFLEVDAPSMLSRLTTIDSALGAILKQQELYNASLMALSGALESIDSRLYGIESKDKSLTGLIELQRRVTRLEQRDERGYVDVPAGSSGSETAAAQGDGQAGTGRVPD